MSVPSPKTEPLKLWIASMGKQAIYEVENPFATFVINVSSRNLGLDKNRLETFTNWGRKYGEGHFILAALAAFPLHLTADLLYTIWQNFKNTEGSPIPRVAVSDLLLSGLLHEVSTELFEYAPDLRRSLLQALQEYHGERDILKELGEFMLDYLATHYAEGVAYTEPIREAEEWNALAYYAPEQANAKLWAAINPSAKNYQTRQLRAVFLAEKLEDQSAIRKLDPSVQEGFERVLTISKGIKPYIEGNFSRAYAELQQLPEFRISGERAGGSEGVASLALPHIVFDAESLRRNMILRKINKAITFNKHIFMSMLETYTTDTNEKEDIIKKVIDVILPTFHHKIEEELENINLVGYLFIVIKNFAHEINEASLSSANSSSKEILNLAYEAISTLLRKRNIYTLDLCQELSSQLVFNIYNLQEKKLISNLPNYIRTAANNLVINYAQKSESNQEVSTENMVILEYTDGFTTLDVLVKEEYDNFNSAQLEIIRIAIGDQDYFMLEAHFRDGESYKTIAEKMGLAVHVVANHINRARVKCQKLKEDGLLEY